MIHFAKISDILQQRLSHGKGAPLLSLQARGLSSEIDFLNVRQIKLHKKQKEQESICFSPPHSHSQLFFPFFCQFPMSLTSK